MVHDAVRPRFLLTAWMALPADPSLAAGVLQSLARLQGRDMPPRRRSSTTRWCASSCPHADRAVEWIETFGDRNGDGYVEYQRATPAGLANQGWKDSWDAIRFADGRLAEPIALCEVQAYIYAAYDFALEAGDIEVFEKYRGKADELRRRFNEDFWLEEQGTYAVGLDADKRPIDAVASKRAIALGRSAEPEKAELVSRRLLAPGQVLGMGGALVGIDHGRVQPRQLPQRLGLASRQRPVARPGSPGTGTSTPPTASSKASWPSLATCSGQLPELFAGFDRSVIAVPAAYSCSPQAWAAASPLLWLRTLLGRAVGARRAVGTARTQTSKRMAVERFATLAPAYVGGAPSEPPRTSPSSCSPGAAKRDHNLQSVHAAEGTAGDQDLWATC